MWQCESKHQHARFIKHLYCPESHYVGWGQDIYASWPRMYFRKPFLQLRICWIWLLLVDVEMKSVVLMMTIWRNGFGARQETTVRKSAYLFERTETRFYIKMDVFNTAALDSVIHMPGSFCLWAFWLYLLVMERGFGPRWLEKRRSKWSAWGFAPWKICSPLANGELTMYCSWRFLFERKSVFNLT